MELHVFLHDMWPVPLPLFFSCQAVRVRCPGAGELRGRAVPSGHVPSGHVPSGRSAERALVTNSAERALVTKCAERARAEQALN